MNPFSLLIKAVFVLLISSPVMLIILAIDEHAQTLQSTEFNIQQSSNIQQLLIDKAPRFLVNSDDQTIQLSQNEINALLYYITSNSSTLATTAFNTLISPDSIEINASLPLPATPFGRFINITLRGVQNQNFITIDSIEIGALRIPAQLYSSLLELVQDALQEENNYQLVQALLASVKRTSLQQDNLSITFNLEADALDNIRNQARQVFINSDEISRLLSYNRQIAAISQNFPPQSNTATLSDFLQPMFTTARNNSLAGADPRDENRAIFTALTVYLTDLRLEHITGPLDEESLITPRQLNVLIESRRDLPRHIISSAAIAASAGADFANILSVYKEVQDSRYRSGTGFSFSDITANYVGTKLGELSVQNSSSANLTQALMSQLESDNHLMPSVTRFDGMSEEEFIERYGNRDSELYRQRILEIEQTVSQQAFFQNFNSAL